MTRDMAGGAAEGEEPLSVIFQRLISNYGPITLQHFMGESNARYYASRDPLGAAGDFVTAPEISQMFGELIGLWLADIWIRAGRPENAHYVELGPGRGTLARDALRAMKRHGLEPRVHLVESSPALRALQLAAVPGAQCHDDLSSVPLHGPILLVANEFLDALPVRQLVRTEQGWRERMVGWQFDGPDGGTGGEIGGAIGGGTGRLVPIAGDRPMDAAVPPSFAESAPGTLIETCPGASAVMYEIGGRLVEQGGAALLIDYGYDQPGTGSSLQAIRAHRKVDPFLMPGEADLTALVDFTAAANAALTRGVRHLGTTTQGDFLRALGIEARTAQLAAAAPNHKDALEAARDRLIEGDQMGELFKVMALASPDWPDGAGL